VGKNGEEGKQKSSFLARPKKKGDNRYGRGKYPDDEHGAPVYRKEADQEGEKIRTKRQRFSNGGLLGNVRLGRGE